MEKNPDTLLQTMQEGEAPHTRFDAIWELRQWVAADTDRNSGGIRRVALRGRSSMNHEVTATGNRSAEVIEALAQRLDEETNAEVRRLIAFVLGQSRDEGAVPNLVRRAREDVDRDVQTAALDALGEIGGALAFRELALLLPQCGDEHLAIRAEAALRGAWEWFRPLQREPAGGGQPGVTRGPSKYGGRQTTPSEQSIYLAKEALHQTAVSHRSSIVRHTALGILALIEEDQRD